jgi:hypothetical protein
MTMAAMRITRRFGLIMTQVIPKTIIFHLICPRTNLLPRKRSARAAARVAVVPEEAGEVSPYGFPVDPALGAYRPKTAVAVAPA